MFMTQRTNIFIAIHRITNGLIFINVQRKVFFKIILNNCFYIKRFLSTIKINLIAN